MCPVFHICYHLFCVLNLSVLHAERLPQHLHCHHLFIYLLLTLLLKPNKFMKLLFHQHWSLLSPWCCRTSSARLSTYMSLHDATRPCSAPYEAQTSYPPWRLHGHWCGCADPNLTAYCELWCSQPQAAGGVWACDIPSAQHGVGSHSHCWGKSHSLPMV